MAPAPLRVQFEVLMLDALDRAVDQGDWERAHILMAGLLKEGIPLRSKCFEQLFHDLLRYGQTDLACRMLEIGPCLPLSKRQLGYMLEDAMPLASRHLMRLLLQRHPACFALNACSFLRVLDHASGQALTVLLQQGWVLPQVNADQLQILLHRLLEAGEQVWACRLLNEYPGLDLAWKALLKVASSHHAQHFVETLWRAMPAED